MPQLGVGPCVATDDRLRQWEYQWSYCPLPRAASPWQEGLFWTGSSGVGGGLNGYGGNSGDVGTQVPRWEPDDGCWGWSDTGGAKMNCIVGQTLDQYGNPLPNCIVQGFLTTNDVFVGQVTSDNGGYYKLPTPYGTAVLHYLVCYKAGVPDVAGTSVNTLVPTTTG